MLKECQLSCTYNSYLKSIFPNYSQEKKTLTTISKSLVYLDVLLKRICRRKVLRSGFKPNSTLQNWFVLFLIDVRSLQHTSHTKTYISRTWDEI